MPEHFDCSPREAVHVGDEIYDARVAASRGIDFIGAGRGDTPPFALQAHSGREVCADSHRLLERTAAG